MENGVCVRVAKKTTQKLDDFYWVFVHETMRKYIVLHDGELGEMDSIRWDLYDEGFDVFWDSARSRRERLDPRGYSSVCPKSLQACLQ